LGVLDMALDGFKNLPIRDARLHAKLAAQNGVVYMAHGGGSSRRDIGNRRYDTVIRG
jgi:hypothetical protein